MLVSVVITMCLVGNVSCIERTVTQEATLMQCGGPMAVQVLPHWMEEEGYLARGYHMTKWGCVIGSRKKESA